MSKYAAHTLIKFQMLKQSYKDKFQSSNDPQNESESFGSDFNSSWSFLIFLPLNTVCISVNIFQIFDDMVKSLWGIANYLSFETFAVIQLRTQVV